MTRAVGIALMLAGLIGCIHLAVASDGEAGVTTVNDRDSGGDAQDSGVVVLTASSFDAVVKAHQFVLVDFYAPWCGHCKTLAPEYAKAAAELRELGLDVVLAKVDCTAETALAERFRITSYPSLKWIVAGQATPYSGPVKAGEDIVGWVLKRAGPSVWVDTPEQLSGLEAQHPLLLLAYLDEADAVQQRAVGEVALQLEGARLVHTRCAVVAAAAGLDAHGVAIVTNLEGKARGLAHISSSSLSQQTSEVLATARAETLPLVVEFSPAAVDTIFNSGIKEQLILWANSSQLAAGHPVSETFRAAAAHYRGRMVFITADSQANDAIGITTFFSLQAAEPPLVIGFHTDSARKFLMQEPVTPDAVQAFAAAVMDGSAHVMYRAAPPPDNPWDGDIALVVASTVEDVVFAADKDVLIQVHSTYCSRCQNMALTYRKLARRFRDVDSVVIAKMDGTQNEHPALEARTYPAIYFVPAEPGAVPIPYGNNETTLTGFTRFIKRFAKLPYSLPKKTSSSSGEEAWEEGDTHWEEGSGKGTEGAVEQPGEAVLGQQPVQAGRQEPPPVNAVPELSLSQPAAPGVPGGLPLTGSDAASTASHVQGKDEL